ncbi:MAG: amidohydrolase family protein, partial [bacterium]|nr:amidohydrolase family protein [bacterium]
MHLSTFLPLQAWARDMLHPYAHGAYAILRAEEMLMNGYTTVRDLGGAANYLRQMIDSGHAPGPRIYPTENWITQTSGHGDFRELNDPHPNITGGRQHFYEDYVTIIADGPDEVTRAARETFRRGATQLKLFTSGGVTSLFDPLHSAPNLEEIQAAVAVADQWGTYVATHSFTEKGILMSIEAGVKSIEHAPFLNETAASAMEEKGLFLVTAVAPVFEVDVETARVTYPPASFAKWIKVREAAKNMVNVVAAHPNLKLAFGTDLLGTIDDIKVTDDKMNLEYGWWDEYIEPARILRGLTSTAAEINAMTGPMNPYSEGPQGVVEAGAYADLLLVDGNPLEDIDLLGDPDTNFKVIMKDGV